MRYFIFITMVFLSSYSKAVLIDYTSLPAAKAAADLMKEQAVDKGLEKLKQKQDKIIVSISAKLNPLRRAQVSILGWMSKNLNHKLCDTLYDILILLKDSPLLIEKNKRAILALETLDSEAHKELIPILQLIVSLKEMAKKLPDIQVYLEDAISYYEEFCKKIINPDTTKLERDKLLENKVMIESPVGYKHYFISQEMARKILAIDEYGRFPWEGPILSVNKVHMDNMTITKTIEGVTDWEMLAQFPGIVLSADDLISYNIPSKVVKLYLYNVKILEPLLNTGLLQEEFTDKEINRFQNDFTEHYRTFEIEVQVA